MLRRCFVLVCFVILASCLGCHDAKTPPLPSQEYDLVASWGTEGDGLGQFKSPAGIAIGPQNRVWVADEEITRVQEFDANGRCLRELALSATPEEKRQTANVNFVFPNDIAFDNDGYLYVADRHYQAIIRFRTDGVPVAQWSYTRVVDYVDTGVRESIALDGFRPAAVSVLAWGGASAVPRIYVADLDSERVAIFGPDLRGPMCWGGHGQQPGQFNQPSGVACGRLPWVSSELQAYRIYVADTMNNRVQVFRTGLDRRMILLSAWGGPGQGPGQFRRPTAMDVDAQCNVFVVDEGNCRIQKFTPDGQLLAVWGTRGTGKGQFVDPAGIAVDAAGNVYVTDRARHDVQRFALRQPR